MKKIIALIAMGLVGLTLIGCGGGDSGSSSTSTTTATSTETGIFIDAPVEGLSYSTPTMSGYTNALGEFQYKTGETVTFKIGHFVLGSAVGGKIMTPLTLTGETDLNNISVKATNIARLLQTLDANISNQGNIEIPIALHDLNVSNINLENESDLNVLLTAAGQMTSISYVLKDSISAKNEMKNFVQLYSQYEILQNKRYFGGSTQYYILNMPNNGNIDLTKYYANKDDNIADGFGSGFVQLYDVNMTYISKTPAQLLAGTYIVKISGLSGSSYVDIYSPVLNPSLAFNSLKNQRYYGGTTQYYILNVPSGGIVIDYTTHYGSYDDEISSAFGSGFIRLYDTNMTYISKSPQQISAGSYILKISGLSSSSYVDVYSPSLN